MGYRRTLLHRVLPAGIGRHASELTDERDGESGMRTNHRLEAICGDRQRDHACRRHGSRRMWRPAEQRDLAEQVTFPQDAQDVLSTGGPLANLDRAFLDEVHLAGRRIAFMEDELAALERSGGN